MANPSSKPTMMRFEPNSGWSDAGANVIPMTDQPPPPPSDAEIADEFLAGLSSQLSTEFPSDALIDIGQSMQDVFDSLKISDPRLQAWTQVHAAIRLISGKLEEKKAMQEKVRSLEQEIEGVRSLAAELVSNAYRSEQEVHETSKLRMQIAESLSEKLSNALKP
jgi:DNA repair ATPase RecN